MDNIEVLKTTVGELRTIVARLVGLPVGVFRLTTAENNEQELFDLHTLDKYDIEIGQTSINLRTTSWSSDRIHDGAMMS